MKKTTNVIWTKDGFEKSMQFESATQAVKAAFDPIYYPLEIPDYSGMQIVISDDATGKILREYTEA